MSADEIKIKSSTVNYAVYEVKVKGLIFEITLTAHAQERIKIWHLTPEVVINSLLSCEEVVTGHHNRFIAHKLKGDSIIRVVYEYEQKIPKIVTVYVPKKERYFQGGGKYANKIFTE